MISPKLLNTNNMYLFNSKCQIQKFGSIIDIIKYFYNERLPLYESRKQYMIKELKEEIQTKENKMKFIKETIERTINISELTKKELEELLCVKNYMKIEDKYNYLIDIPLYKMTKDEMQNLDNDINRIKELLVCIESKSSEDMWIDDINELEKSYDLYYKERMNKYLDIQIYGDYITQEKETKKNKTKNIKKYL